MISNGRFEEFEVVILSFFSFFCLLVYLCLLKGYRSLSSGVVYGKVDLLRDYSISFCPTVLMFLSISSFLHIASVNLTSVQIATC